MSAPIPVPRPHRAAPDVPNAVSGNVTPLRPAKPETVRFTVRVSSEALAYLRDLADRSDLAERFERYQRTPGYDFKTKHTRSITLDRRTHKRMIDEAHVAGLTLNGFIERLLTDGNLDEGAHDPDGRYKQTGGPWGPLIPPP